jgi:hypothetical protein
MVLRLDQTAGSVDDIDYDGIIITAIVITITATINDPVKF